MEWRERFLRTVGPGLLGGVTLGVWRRLLRENDYAVSPTCLPRILSITYQAVQNSLIQLREDVVDPPTVPVDVPPPLFVLGHWRQGTTHLHNLLTIDDRFAFPNMYHCMFPFTFVTSEALQARFIDLLLPRRRPMDNMQWNMRSPQEDEFALALMCQKSSYLGWVFPRRFEHYGRYLTMRDVTADDVAQWKSALMRFLSKLTRHLQHPLILKSPTHTCRIRLLLELFPKARFVHIHRNPYAVFPSNLSMFRNGFAFHQVQRQANIDLEQWTINQYRSMYDAYFEERGLVPPGHLHDIAFEDLEQDPLGEIRRLYSALSLPDFSYVEPKLREYIDLLAGYQKNRFPDLPAELRQRIARAWSPCFEEWNYAR